MKKSVLPLMIAALVSAAWPAEAQTCLKTPSCAELGYSKSAADCAGKTILKCPLDTNKVYCPSGTETENKKTYAVGDYYYYNNNAVGRVISVAGDNLTVASNPVAANEISVAGLANYCSQLSTAGGAWYTPSAKETCEKIRSAWTELQSYKMGIIISKSNDNFCSTDTSCYCRSYVTTDSYHYVCLATFKA